MKRNTYGLAKSLSDASLIFLIFAAGCFALVHLRLFSIEKSPAKAPPAHEIKVVMDDNYPPYAFRGKDGELMGISVDMWKLWEKKTGYKAELFGLDWEKALGAIESGDYDAIDTIFLTPQRSEKFLFSEQYCCIDVPLFYHKDISGIQTATDLKGFVVGAKRGDNTVKVLRDGGTNSIIELSNFESVIKAAIEGRIKAFAADAPAADYLLHKYGAASDFRRTEPLYSSGLRRAYLKSDKETMLLVEDGFRRISKDELAGIQRKWEEPPVISHKTQLLVLIISAAAMLALLLVTVRLHFLRKTVRGKSSALAVANGYLSAIFDSVSDVIFIHNEDGSICDVNRRFTEIYGYSREDALRMKIEELSSDEGAFYSQRVALKMLDDARKGNTQIFEWQARRKDGTVFPVEVSIRFAKIGNENKFIVSVRDISRRKKSEYALLESEQRFAATLSAMDDMVFAFDTQGRFIFYHAPKSSSLFIAPALFIGKKHSEVMPPDITLMFDAAMKENAEGRSSSYDYPITIAEEEKWYSTVQSPLFIGKNFSGSIAVVREITERKRFENQISSSLAEKESLLRELYHRTKNNMQVIISLMSLHSMSFKDEGVKTMIREIQERIQSMALVHQMLYKSQNLCSINLAGYIEELIDLLRKGFRINDEKIHIDLRLEEVLISIDTAIPCGLIVNELITNSIKHAFPGSRCGTISITLAKNSGKRITLTVSDDGEGVADGFDGEKDFHIGLKSVVSIATGQLRGGCEFSLSNGFCATVTFREITPGRKNTMRGKLKVMIVEDEAISALVMKEELSAVGYDICGPVSTGEDAVRTAEREKPDVMLIDINLIGKMNGIDAAAQIRKFSSAHIIFLTGYSTKDICKIAADVNPSGFLDKPVVVDDVQRLIERLFESD